MWSNGWYSSHSELTTKENNKRQNLYKKLARTIDFKIEKPIIYTCLVLETWILAKPKQKTRRKQLHSKVFERIKESKWGTFCKFMWIWDLGRNITQWMLAESVSQCSAKFYMQSVMVFSNNLFNGEITFHLKRILIVRLCYYKWKTWYKLLSSSGVKEFYTRQHDCVEIL